MELDTQSSASRQHYIDTGRYLALMRCDSCGKPVRDPARLAHYGDKLGVDWVLCAACESES